MNDHLVLLGVYFLLRSIYNYSGVRRPNGVNAAGVVPMLYDVVFVYEPCLRNLYSVHWTLVERGTISLSLSLFLLMLLDSDHEIPFLHRYYLFKENQKQIPAMELNSAYFFVV